MITEKEKILKIKAYTKEQGEIFWSWFRGGRVGKPHYPPLPPELEGATCNARTRNGGLCKRKDIMQNGRCKLHGGYSTGPRTLEGKAKSSQNARKTKPIEVGGELKPHECHSNA